MKQWNELTTAGGTGVHPAGPIIAARGLTRVYPLEACEVIGNELKKIQCEPVTADELARAKEHVKGRLVLSGESTAARMSRIARATLHDIPLLNLDEMLAKVDAVSVEDVSELASELYGEARLSAAGVGRDEDRFRAAIAPVSGALAA